MTEQGKAPAAGSAEKIPWREWNASYEVPESERDQWARRVLSGDTISVATGDSMVWSEYDDGEIEITDVLVRRTARVPMPPGYMDRFQLVTALADALELLVGQLDGMRDFVCPDGGAESLVAARAALRAAGRMGERSEPAEGRPSPEIPAIPDSKG